MFNPQITTLINSATVPPGTGVTKDGLPYLVYNTVSIDMESLSDGYLNTFYQVVTGPRIEVRERKRRSIDYLTGTIEKYYNIMLNANSYIKDGETKTGKRPNYMFVTYDGVCPTGMIPYVRERRYKNLDPNMRNFVSPSGNNRNIYYPYTSHTRYMKNEVHKYLLRNRSKFATSLTFSNSFVNGESIAKIAQHIKDAIVKNNKSYNLIFTKNMNIIYMIILGKIQNVILYVDSEHVIDCNTVIDNLGVKYEDYILSSLMFDSPFIPTNSTPNDGDKTIIAEAFKFIDMSAMMNKSMFVDKDDGKKYATVSNLRGMFRTLYSQQKRIYGDDIDGIIIRSIFGNLYEQMKGSEQQIKDECCEIFLDVLFRSYSYYTNLKWRGDTIYTFPIIPCFSWLLEYVKDDIEISDYSNEEETFITPLCYILSTVPRGDQELIPKLFRDNMATSPIADSFISGQYSQGILQPIPIYRWKIPPAPIMRIQEYVNAARMKESLYKVEKEYTTYHSEANIKDRKLAEEARAESIRMAAQYNAKRQLHIADIAETRNAMMKAYFNKSTAVTNIKIKHYTVEQWSKLPDLLEKY